MKNYSIKDIAEISGVSVATVSRVINNNGRFSEKTRQKVLKAIEETGYKMNYNAKSLRMNKSFSIGILVPDIRNFFFSSVVQKIEEILFEKGYSTIICNTARNEKKEVAYLQMLQGKGVDGLIVISGVEAFEFEHSSSVKQIPYICIDREPKQKEKTIFISSNHYQGAQAATQQLILSGCKHPVIAMYTQNSSSSTERFKGFKDTLKQAGILFDLEKNVIKFDHNSPSFSTYLKEFLAENPEVDGIFSINDTIALNILMLASSLGKQVPEQLKLIGFDDIPCASYSTPALSSVKQDTVEIARAAVDSLLLLLSHPEQTGKSIVVPVELILRETSQK